MTIQAEPVMAVLLVGGSGGIMRGRARAAHVSRQSAAGGRRQTKVGRMLDKDGRKLEAMQGSMNSSLYQHMAAH